MKSKKNQLAEQFLTVFQKKSSKKKSKREILKKSIFKIRKEVQVIL